MMTKAMARALEIHKPAEKLPEWKAKRQDELANTIRLNRNRASLVSDSLTTQISVFSSIMGNEVSSEPLAPRLEIINDKLKTAHHAILCLINMGLKPGEIDELFQEVHAGGMVYGATNGEEYVEPDILGMLERFDADRQPTTME